LEALVVAVAEMFLLLPVRLAQQVKVTLVAVEIKVGVMALVAVERMAQAQAEVLLELAMVAAVMEQQVH
jgi:type III secretory pathway component EscT